MTIRKVFAIDLGVGRCYRAYGGGQKMMDSMVVASLEAIQQMIQFPTLWVRAGEVDEHFTIEHANYKELSRYCEIGR